MKLILANTTILKCYKLEIDEVESNRYKERIARNRFCFIVIDFCYYDDGLVSLDVKQVIEENV